MWSTLLLPVVAEVAVGQAPEAAVPEVCLPDSLVWPSGLPSL
jgi:hypothetical protein